MDVLFWKFIPKDSDMYDAGQTIEVWGCDGNNNTLTNDFLLASAVSYRNLGLWSSIVTLLGSFF